MPFVFAHAPMQVCRSCQTSDS